MALIQQICVLMYCIPIYVFAFAFLKQKKKKFFGLFINYTQKNKFYPDLTFIKHGYQLLCSKNF